MPIDLPAPPRRILIIKPSSLGDIVHALPVLAMLKKRWPDAQVSWLVGSAFAGLLDGHPLLHDIIPFDRRRFARAWWNPAAFFELIKFVVTLRRRHFDLVVDLQGLLRSGITARLARSPARVGFRNAREMAWIFYTMRVASDKNQHAVDRNLQITDALGCPREATEFPLLASNEDRAAVEALLPRDREYAILLPGTNWPTKRWPVESFAALVGPLKRRWNLTAVVAGGAADGALARQMPGAIDLTGRTTLRQLVALLERAQIVVANDSGPMHIAAALNRPLVTMFGPTNPLRTGPWNRQDSVLRIELPCSPCYSRTCSHQSCLRWLSAEAVLKLIEAQLDSSSRT